MSCKFDSETICFFGYLAPDLYANYGRYPPASTNNAYLWTSRIVIYVSSLSILGSESENWRKDMRPPSPRGGHSRRGGRGGGMRGRGRGGIRGRGGRIDAESLTGENNLGKNAVFPHNFR